MNTIISLSKFRFFKVTAKNGRKCNILFVQLKRYFKKVYVLSMELSFIGKCKDVIL